MGNLEAHMRQLERQALTNGTRSAQQLIKANIVAQGRVRTGRMANSVSINRDGRTSATVSVDTRYAIWQEEGRGWVFPKKAKALRFRPKGSAKFVFAARARPAAGIHMVKKAAQALRARHFFPR